MGPGGTRGRRSIISEGGRGEQHRRRSDPADRRSQRPARRHRQRRDHPGRDPAPRRSRRAQPGYRRGRRPGQGRLLRRPGPARRGPGGLQPQAPAPGSSTTARPRPRRTITSPASGWSASARASTGSAAGRSPRARATIRSWSFKFGSSTADLNDGALRRAAPRSGCGTSRSIPFFPFFGAAIRRERQTGFLYPEFGNSSQQGRLREDPVLLGDQRQPGSDGGPRHLYPAGRGRRGRVPLHHVRARPRQRQRLSHARVPARFRRTASGSTFPCCAASARQSTTGRSRRGSSFKARRQCHHRRPRVPGVRRPARRSGPPARGDERLPQPALGCVQPHRQRALVPGPHDAGRHRAAADAGDQALRRAAARSRGCRGFLYETEASFTNFIRDVGRRRLRIDLHPRVYYPIPVAGARHRHAVRGADASRTTTSTSVGDARHPDRGDRRGDDARAPRAPPGRGRLRGRDPRHARVQHGRTGRPLRAPARDRAARHVPDDPRATIRRAIPSTIATDRPASAASRRSSTRSPIGSTRRRWRPRSRGGAVGGGARSRSRRSTTSTGRSRTDEPFKDLQGEFIFDPNAILRFRGARRLQHVRPGVPRGQHGPHGALPRRGGRGRLALRRGRRRQLGGRRGDGAHPRQRRRPREHQLGRARTRRWSRAASASTWRFQCFAHHGSSTSTARTTRASSGSP